jgi:hypothetical protein
MKTYSILLVAALFFIANGCTSPTEKVEETEETGLVVSVEAVPQVITADGVSESVIFVEVQRNGVSVPDSTQVLLFRTLGRLKGGRAYTYQGVALDTLVADTTAGTSSVIAYVEGQRDTVDIVFAEP